MEEYLPQMIHSILITKKPKEARKPQFQPKRFCPDRHPPLYKVLAPPCWTDFAQILAQDAEINYEQIHKVLNPYAKPFKS